MSKLSFEEIETELIENHNHSWFTELYNRNKKNLDDIALIYRGNNITYYELFTNIGKYAKSLKKLGLGLNDEIPVCLSNSPEIVYVIGAASMIGAKVNIFGSHFPINYITDIINSCNSKILFIEDNNYLRIKEAIDSIKIEKVILISLSDSLKNKNNPYKSIEKYPELFESKVEMIKKNDNRAISQEEFVTIGIDYDGQIYEKIDMNQDFIITYTSGSTNEDRPKAIVHSSKSFIYVARFHDKDYNGIDTKSFTSLAHIPTYSNTNLVSCISDSLMQGAKVGMEPIYDEDMFIKSLLIYKPHFVAATKSFWINLAKKVLYNQNYKNIIFDNLLLAFSCGESFEINEEKIINKALKKAKAGTKVTHTPFSIIKMSEAAGDCEHGSIFYSLFRSIQNINPRNIKKHEAAGLSYFPFVKVAVLDENGNVLGKNNYGRIVANSPCTMKRYNNNAEATEKFYIKDNNGYLWADMSLYGYIDETDKVHINGRIMDNEPFHPSIISKMILKDTKNIMSCEVVKNKDSNDYIAHIELYPTTKKDIKSIIIGANTRCKNILNLYNINLYFRIRNNDESYPLTKSGKRDVKKIIKEGLTEKCLIPTIDNGKYELTRYEKIESEKVLKR